MGRVNDKYKEDIKKYGRQIDEIITYKIKGKEYLIDSDKIFSITPTVKSNILKSAMKQLDFESSVKIPKGTIINVQFGVYEGERCLTVEEVSEMKVSRLNDMQIKYLLGFEYVNFGDYIIYEEPKYNADTYSYSYTCYDKMLYSMKDYKKLNVTYPITVREYINKICESIGLIFKNKNDIFVNYNKKIKSDLYEGYEYKYRDILDELAQVTASTICINEETNELEIRYINKTNDIIDEDYLKDINVEFAEKYGPINSIVLSRSAESDNVYLRDENSVSTNGLCELKIIDNQIMNDNDRSDFLPEILEKLNGLNYYINDFNSKGITWLKLCDEYTVKIEQNLFNCVLFNDEIKITQGLEETIYTDMPEISETDYTKGDKTDRRLNKAYRILDKQNQKIEDLLSQQTETTDKLSKHEQTIDSMKDTLSSQETKIETVESKVNTAQSTADTATTKANNAQSTANIANTNAQNAKKTADANTTKITTNTTKIAEVEKTVNGITQSVSNVEEKVETVESTANTAKTTAESAQSTANTAKSTADTAKKTAENTNNNLTTNYYTKTQTENKITQTAESTISEVSKTYSTKTETSTAKTEAINSANSNTDNKLKDYTETSKLGTAIEQNYEHVKIAWNQISEFIQMMIINNNASFAILDSNKKVMMALDKLGQHFYNNSSKIFAEMGVKTVDNDNYIAFSVPSDYAKSISDGMAWGITTSSDNKFLPVLFLKNFSVGNKNAGNYNGELVLKFCDLVLEGLESGIKAGDVKIYGNMFNGITFEDTTTGQVLLDITPANSSLGVDNDEISILNKIKFYKNVGGTNSFKIGNDSYVLITDEGSLQVQNGNVSFGGNNSKVSFDLYVKSLANITGNLNVNGNIYANNISSDKRIKKNIRNSTTRAIDIIKKIKHREFDKKDDGKHYNIGYIAQEMEEIDSNFVIVRPKTEETEERYYINELPIIATLTKAIQEQQEEIEQLKVKIEEMEEK